MVDRKRANENLQAGKVKDERTKGTYGTSPNRAYLASSNASIQIQSCGWLQIRSGRYTNCSTVKRG